HRARHEDRQGALAPEGGRHQRGLFDDRRASGRRRSGADRRLGRGIRHARVHRRMGSGVGQAPLAHLHDSKPRRARRRYVEGDTWKLGGGSTWITGSYDPELNAVYWGIGNPGPFNSAVRPGDNLYTCSVLALDPKTGKIKWHYQFSPNNPFDYDSVA